MRPHPRAPRTKQSLPSFSLGNFALRLLLCSLLVQTLFFGLAQASKAGQGIPAVADLPVRMVPAGDVTVACRETGKGTPLLMLTGYACPAEVWDGRLVASLAKKHRVLLCDYRGMGQSTVTAEPFSLHRFAQDAAAVLTTHVKGKADVLGWSMGTMVALELAALAPERVGKLVLLGAVHDPATAEAAIARMHAMTPDVLHQQLFPKAWSDDHPQALSRLPRPGCAPDATVVARQRQALGTWKNLDTALLGMQNNVLLIVGTKDWVTPPDETEALAKLLPHSRVTLLPNAGHWLMYQYPEKLARLVNTFLSRP